MSDVDNVYAVLNHILTHGELPSKSEIDALVELTARTQNAPTRDGSVDEDMWIALRTLTTQARLYRAAVLDLAEAFKE